MGININTSILENTDAPNADNIKIIDDVVKNFVEWADEPTDDIQDAWVDIQESLRIYHDNAIKLKSLGIYFNTKEKNKC